MKDRKYFDSGDYALDKLRSKQQQEKQDLSLQTPPADDQSSPLPNGLPTSAHHIPQMSGSPQKIPDDDFITSTVDDNNYLPLPNLEKFQNLQKKKSITRNGSVISITNKEITGINTKSNLETEVDSEDI